MNEVYERIVNWNAARYDRVYDQNLAAQLLIEELYEFYESTEDVDKLDALCDLVYVALGVCWKLNITDDHMNAAIYEAERQVTTLIAGETIYPVFLISSYLSAFQHDDEMDIATAMHAIVMICMVEMKMMRLTEEEAMEALLIVCDSNDSKSVQKVDSHIKANGSDKGPYYKAPEPKLRILLEKVNARHH